MIATMSTPLRKALAVLVTGLLASNAFADILSDYDWHFTGFGTLGYTTAGNHDDRYFRRNIYQDGLDLHRDGWLVDSRLGLQVRGEINDNWDVVAQAVVRHQYANDIEDYFDVAFIRYRPDDRWEFTFGRQPFDLFFLSDHRNTAYSYDWVRPPTEFYGIIPYDSFDGVKVARKWGDFDSEWRFSLSVGNIKEQFETDAFDEDDDEPGEEESQDITRAEPIYNAELTWQRNEWQFRANYALLEFKQEFDEVLEFEFLVDVIGPFWPDLFLIRDDFLIDTTMNYAAVGAYWNTAEWKFKTEFSVIDADFAHFNGERAYVHLSRRFGDWSPYASVGYAHDDRVFGYRPPLVDALFDGTDLIEFFDDVREEYTALRNNQHSVSLGVRWDFAPKKALKFQCDRFYFDAGSGSVQGRPDADYSRDEEKTWCSLNFDWVF